jgi:hypothetical protein
MTNNKYPSKYSNGRTVSAAQYITELICEKKAKIDNKDLHYKFWTNKEWSGFYKNQIASANKLLKTYSANAIIKALNNDKAKKVYSLRSPFLVPIIKDEEDKLSRVNTKLTKELERKKTVKFNQTSNNKNHILSKLKDIDNGIE